MYIDLSGFEPEWYDLIFCPKCNEVVTSVQDTEEQTSFVCHNCNKEFDFIHDSSIAMPRIKIRPAPKSILNILIRDNGEFSISGRDQKRIYLYCFMEWENFEDKQGRPLRLTNAIKEKIYDQAAQGIAPFVLSKSRQFEEIKKDLIKN